jgi:hypothetical protein
MLNRLLAPLSRGKLHFGHIGAPRVASPLVGDTAHMARAAVRQHCGPTSFSNSTPWLRTWRHAIGFAPFSLVLRFRLHVLHVFRTEKARHVL